jgi:UDP-N-acetylmuramoyl-tripeptide--D-alanyl-D-alanine ligase
MKYLITPTQTIQAYQLEWYDIARFFSLLASLQKQPKIFNTPIERTSKLMRVISSWIGAFLLLYTATIVYFFWNHISNTSQLIAIVWAIIATYILFPLIIFLWHCINHPLQFLVTSYIISKTRKLILNHPHLTIIAITGSWGKTSVKTLVTTLLSSHFKVVTTPGNINTPLGIARYIQHNLKKEDEILIVEMGAYTKGNIKQLCHMCPPHKSILTALGNQHLERFGSIQSIVEWKMEIYEWLRENGVLYYDASWDIESKLDNYFSSHTKTHELIGIKAQAISFLSDYQGICFSYEGQSYTSKLLAMHSAHQIALCAKVCEDLGMSNNQIQAGINQLNYTKHRLELIKNETTNVWIIDDSYNGNIAWSRSTIQLLTHNTTRRKVYITPWIFELGNKTMETNFQIGKELYPALDLLVVIASNASKALLEWYKSMGNKAYLQFDTREQTHQQLGTFVQSGDMVIFQNDATENYL